MLLDQMIVTRARKGGERREVNVLRKYERNEAMDA
jgi:hypothetical protein